MRLPRIQLGIDIVDEAKHTAKRYPMMGLIKGKHK